MWLFLWCALALCNYTIMIRAQDTLTTTTDQQRELEISEINDDEDITDILATIDIPAGEEIPRPVFHKPSLVEVFFRKVGLYTLFTLFNAQDWCVKKINTVTGAFKAMRYTL